MSYLSKTATVVGVTAGLAGLPSVGTAQFNVEARGGAAFPAGDLGDLTDVGGNLGIGIGYWIHPRLNLRADGNVDILTGARAGLPDLRLWSYTGGVEASVLDPHVTRWTLMANVGAGATTLDTDDFDGTDVTKTYFALNGGLRFGYDVSRRVNVFVGGQAYLTFADEDDLRPLAELTPALSGENVDRLWSFPLFAGVRFHLPGGQPRVTAR